MKKYKIICFMIIIFLVMFFSVNCYRYIKNDNLIKDSYKDRLLECETGQYTDTYCSMLESDSRNTSDFLYMFYECFVIGGRKLLYPLIIMIFVLSTWYPSKYFRHNMLEKELTRTSYNSAIKQIFLKSYLSVLILPITCIIVMCICATYNSGFVSTISIDYNVTIWKNTILIHPVIFAVIYILNLLIHAVLYTNISLIIVRKHHNHFVAILLSFFTFIGIQCFLEIFIGGIIYNTILNAQGGIIFNIMNWLTFNDYYNIFTPLIVPSIIMLLSFGMIYIVYKNKESLIIDCEKEK